MPTQKLTTVVKSVSIEPDIQGKKRLTLVLIVDENAEVEDAINENEEFDIELPSRPQP